MFRHGLLVLLATTLSNVCAFLFHVVVSRTLGVADYGALYALVSVVSVASLPAGIFSTVVAKFAAEFRALNDPAHLRALTIGVCKLFGAGAAAYVVAGLAFAVPIAEFLRVPVWAVATAAVMAGAGILVPTLRAISQGTQDFRGYSLSVVIDGVGKAFLGAILTIAKLGLAGGLIGFFAGTILGGTYLGRRLWLQHGKAPHTDLHIDGRRVGATTVGAAALMISVTILSYGDVILVKHFFSAHDAGIYAATSLGGKILLFLVGFAPMVLLPKTVDRDRRGQNSIAALGAALLMVAVLSAVGLLAFHFGAAFILRVLVGGNFSEAATFLVWYGLAMALLAMTNIVASYSIALHSFAFAGPLVLVTIAEIATIALHHPSLSFVISILLIGNALALAVVGASVALRLRNPKRFLGSV
jgi:O-antigen/teichoic acid export membrane protein